MPRDRFADPVLEDLFSYHPPTAENVEQYRKIREAALNFAKVARDQSPDSADQAYGIRLIRMAMMTFNAAVATKGKG